MVRDIEELKKRLRLENTDLPNLNIAFTHRSFAVEHGLDYDNQRLEFLGDAVLEIILTEFLYHLYPDYAEGEMTKIRAALVREKTLAVLAGDLELGEYLLVGKGESDCGGNSRPSTLADLFEAVLGALYLDAGFSTVRDLVIKLVQRKYPRPHELLESMNPKGQLQEYVQKRWGETPKYAILRVSGPEHLPHYEVEVTVREYTALGSAASRKLAEGDAAGKLYAHLMEVESKEEHK